MSSQNQIKFERSECVFVSGRRNCYHPIKPKAFFCLVSPTQRPLACSSQVLIQICFIKILLPLYIKFGRFIYPGEGHGDFESTGDGNKGLEIRE